MTDRTIPNAAMLSGWRKSSYSSPNADSCLEVLDHHASGIPVRDSKTPHGPALLFPASDWSAFITAVKGGEFRPSSR
ncbi:DUF397 domain-containing protein [Streptomyces sp. TRM72054]|uniref:DUF397 domain-containing protein n=1 Tax=Streptomyces sp. TRM72054 TaxID=2870562 RepID=UPI001C8C5C20|nr:DUF397 domain-containing protein [Streptomyces sp. TRM72054]MBX9399171.1 DUF397 domain-containing protein [Streptomyces sp. TRM72054]